MSVNPNQNQEKQEHYCSATDLCLVHTCHSNKVHCSTCKTQDHKMHGKYVISTSLFKSKLKQHDPYHQLSGQSPVKQLGQLFQELRNQFESNMKQMEDVLVKNVPDFAILENIKRIEDWQQKDIEQCIQLFSYSLEKKSIKMVRPINTNLQQSLEAKQKLSKIAQNFQDSMLTGFTDMGKIIRNIHESQQLEPKNEESGQSKNKNQNQNNSSMLLRKRGLSEVAVNFSQDQEEQLDATRKIKILENKRSSQEQVSEDDVNLKYKAVSQIEKDSGIKKSVDKIETEEENQNNAKNTQSDSQVQHIDNYTREFKTKVVKEAIQVRNIKKTYEKHNVTSTQLRLWRKMYGNNQDLIKDNIEFEENNKFIAKARRRNPEQLVQQSIECWETIMQDQSVIVSKEEQAQQLAYLRSLYPNSQQQQKMESQTSITQSQTDLNYQHNPSEENRKQSKNQGSDNEVINKDRIAKNAQLMEQQSLLIQKKLEEQQKKEEQNRLKQSQQKPQLKQQQQEETDQIEQEQEEQQKQQDQMKQLKIEEEDQQKIEQENMLRQQLEKEEQEKKERLIQEQKEQQQLKEAKEKEAREKELLLQQQQKEQQEKELKEKQEQEKQEQEELLMKKKRDQLLVENSNLKIQEYREQIKNIPQLIQRTGNSGLSNLTAFSIEPKELEIWKSQLANNNNNSISNNQQYEGKIFIGVQGNYCNIYIKNVTAQGLQKVGILEQGNNNKQVFEDKDNEQDILRVKQFYYKGDNLLIMSRKNGIIQIWNVNNRFRLMSFNCREKSENETDLEHYPILDFHVNLEIKHDPQLFVQTQSGLVTQFQILQKQGQFLNLSKLFDRSLYLDENKADKIKLIEKEDTYQLVARSLNTFRVGIKNYLCCSFQNKIKIYEMKSNSEKTTRVYERNFNNEISFIEYQFDSLFVCDLKGQLVQIQHEEFLIETIQSQSLIDNNNNPSQNQQKQQFFVKKIISQKDDRGAPVAFSFYVHQEHQIKNIADESQNNNNDENINTKQYVFLVFKSYCKVYRLSPKFELIKKMSFESLCTINKGSINFGGLCAYQIFLSDSQLQYQKSLLKSASSVVSNNPGEVEKVPINCQIFFSLTNDTLHLQTVKLQ